MRYTRPWLLLLLALSTINTQAADNDTHYAITGVAQGDTLNIRARPDPSSATIGSIPYNAHGIIATGRQQRHRGSLWREVRHDGDIGWVNDHYLRAEPATLFPVPLDCSGTEPFWSLNIDQRAQFTTPEQRYPAIPGLPAQRSLNRLDHWTLTLQPADSPGPAFAAILDTRQCSDGMSDNRYRYEIVLRLHGQTWSGCCNRLP